MAIRLRRRLPRRAGARVEMLPGLGHSPLLEDPPRTAMFLLAFTATHGTRAASTERTSP